MMGLISSLLTKNNLKIFAILGVVIASIFGCRYLYNKGYDNGVAEITAKITAEKIQWEKKVSELQNDNDRKIELIEKEYAQKVTTLNSEIDKLRKNPKVIKQYIPIDSNISKGTVLLHDRLACGVGINEVIPDDIDVSLESEYGVTDLVNTVAVNYNNCNQCIEKLTTLQTIVKQFMEKQQKLLK